MIDNGWNSELVNLIWSEDFTWSHAFSYIQDGVQAEAMLVLFEVATSEQGDSQKFRAGFWGLSGETEGRELHNFELQGARIDENTDEALAWTNSIGVLGGWPSGVPVSENWSHWQFTRYQEIGMVGIAKGATYAGGAVFGVSVALSTAGVGVPAYLTFASAGLTVTGLGFQALEDTGLAESTKYYHIFHVNSLENYNGGGRGSIHIGIEKPLGFH